MPAFLVIYKRVVETDMLFPLLVYFIAISLGTMYEFLFIMGFLLVCVTFLLTIAHFKKNEKLRKIAKMANVTLTVIGFINIFASDFYFD